MTTHETALAMKVAELWNDDKVKADFDSELADKILALLIKERAFLVAEHNFTLNYYRREYWKQSKELLDLQTEIKLKHK